MTTKQKYESLFPLKGYITQEIIDSAEVTHPGKCIGAMALRNALGENINLIHKKWRDNIWGYKNGQQIISVPEGADFDSVRLGTIEGIDLTEVRTPMEVTFILKPL